MGFVEGSRCRVCRRRRRMAGVGDATRWEPDLISSHPTSSHLISPRPYPAGANLILTETLHPTPYTLHPTPYTLHSTPYTLHPLHPTFYILRVSFELHATRTRYTLTRTAPAHSRRRRRPSWSTQVSDESPCRSRTSPRPRVNG